jgi:nucleoside-diphosphate-sugar epimerase
MKRILIIGGQGLVGRTFQALYRGQYDLTVVGREAGVNLHEAFSGHYDCCIFLAQSREYRLGAFTADLLHVNVELVRDVMAACAGHTPQFILFSSGSVYQPSENPCDEDAPLDWTSRSPYVLSKLMGEMVTRTFSKDFESMVVCRPFAIFGPGQHQDMLFERLRQNILNHREITLGQDGGLLFNPVLAHDVCASLEKLIEDRPGDLIIQNLFGAEPVLLADVVARMGERLGIVPRTNISQAPLKTVLGASLNSYNVVQHSLEESLDVFLHA